MRNPNDKKYANFYERWDWLVTFMVVEDRFVHHVLLMMDKSRNDAVGTMGVSVEGTRISLVYNEKFVESLSDAELRFVITHEVYHLVLHHCTIRLPQDKKDRELYNIAADLAINSLIKQDVNRTMPKDEKGKLLPFSSTMAKAQAGVESYQYFRVANYLRGIIESIEQNLMALGGESKNYNRFGQNAENSISDSDKIDEELED